MTDSPTTAARLEPVSDRPRTVDGGYDASGKSSAEIERDIARTRAQLGTLIDSLEDKLAPRRLLDQGMDALRDRVSEEGGRIGRAVRGNSMPLVLMGAGLGWMLLASRSGDADRPAGTDSSAPTLSDLRRDDDLVSPAWVPMEENAGRAFGAAEPSMGPGMADRIRERVSRVAEQNPLVLGFVALLAGTALAFALPTTRAEGRWVGRAREGLRDQVQSLGREAADRAQLAAERAVDAATEAVRESAEEVGR